MSNLKEELQELVKEFRLHSTIIVDLASLAFNEIVTAAISQAKQGKDCLKNHPISFTGCKGGYSNLVEEVIKHLRKILDKERMTYTIADDSEYRGCGYMITLYW